MIAMQSEWQQILSGTPWWVWALAVYFINMGYQATKPRTVPLLRLAILPTLFFYLSLQNLLHAFNFGPLTIATWASALICGISLGWWRNKRTPIQVDQQKKQVHLPGSWIPLILVIGIFSIKYYFGYTQATNPQRFKDPLFELTTLSLTSLFSGFFCGQFARLLFLTFLPKVPESPSELSGA